jgi:NhaA family Na+:H+ antiporter
VLIYFLITMGESAASAWGVVVATDIAFALAAFRLAGGVPGSLATLILAFAIVDDAFGVLIIAIFYSNDISFGALAFVALFLGLVILCRRLGIWSLTVYAILGALSWLAIVESGVHPTMVGAALGLLTPVTPLFKRTEATDLIARVAQRLQTIESRRAEAGRYSAEFQRLEEKEETIFGYLETAVAGSEAPAERLIRWLNPWVGYLVLPVFALANAGIDLSPDALAAAAGDRIAWAIMAALVLGKPIGILLFAGCAMRVGWGRLPRGLGLRDIGSMGVLGGIGFTVSLFIADLSLSGNERLGSVKLAILAASFLAGVAGFILLRWLRQEAPAR